MNKYHPLENKEQAQIFVTQFRNWGNLTNHLISIGLVECGYDKQLELTIEGDKYRDKHYKEFSPPLSEEEETLLDLMLDEYDLTRFSKWTEKDTNLNNCK